MSNVKDGFLIRAWLLSRFHALSASCSALASARTLRASGVRSTSREKVRGENRYHFVQPNSDKADGCYKRQSQAYLSFERCFLGHASDQRNVDENARKTRQDNSIHAGRSFHPLVNAPNTLEPQL